MSANNIILILIVIICLISCSDYYAQYENGDTFYIRNKGADMPVVVKGNNSSNIFIIALHGGPRDTAFSFVSSDAFKKLERNYRMVYWDQRLSGNSEGNPDKNSFTLSQCTEDLDLLVDVVKNKYKYAEIFLLGHSWGGALGNEYLLESIERQNKIKGWISVEAMISFKFYLSICKDFVIEYASDNGGDSYWREALLWCNNISDYDKDVMKKLIGYVEKLLPASSQKSGFDTVTSETIFFSPFNYMWQGLNVSNILTDEGQSFLISIDVISRMSTIAIPTVIMRGDYFPFMTTRMAEKEYNTIGTPEINKKIVYFENASHWLMLDDPGKFYNTIVEFVEKYK
ncbi:MAG TPA: alpha/beta hydrolase [Spirochaetota bacterium]|nr:alpha/beta hydrolase [Spirochaetota bacterium]